MTESVPQRDEPLPAFWDQDFFANPRAAALALQAAGPVHETRLPMGLPVHVLTRYQDVRAALNDNRLGKEADVLIPVMRNELERVGPAVPEELLSVLINTSILFSDGAHHNRLKEPVKRVFTAGRVEALEPRIRQLTRELLDAIPTDQPVDLLTAFASPLPVRVIAQLLGAPESDAGRFREWSEALMDDRDLALAKKTGDEAGAYFAELCQRKAARPGDDLISALLTSGLDLPDVVNALVLLLVAGNDSTKNLIGNGVVELLRQPAVWAELRADPSLIPGAVQELLRLVSPVRMTSHHYTREPVEFGGTTIPAGRIVLGWVGAANLDPAVFGPDAGELDIRRPDAARHLAFGHGLHRCLGAALAPTQLEIVLREMTARYENPALAVDAAELEPRDAWVANGLRALPVRLR